MLSSSTSTVILLCALFCNISSQDNSKDDLISDIFGEEQETTPEPDVSTASNRNEEDCECVLYYLCNNGTINNNGEGIIDPRMSECPHYLQICCGGDNMVPPTTPTPPIVPIGCGHRNPKGVDFKIQNPMDNEAEYGEFPWMTAVYYEEHLEASSKDKILYQCGGALIHPQVVVTAAHCVKKDKKLKIRAGEWDTQTQNERYPFQDRDVSSVKIHPQYYAGALFNDIALLFLDEPVELAQHINVVCLPPQDAVINHRECFSSGWGKDVFGKEGKYQVILKKVELPIVPRRKCQESLRSTRLGKYFDLHRSFVCAGGEAGKDTCKGDGGSPLVCPIQGHEERYYQVGIVAWGIGCGENDIPGVYVNVALFRKWIDGELRSRNFDIDVYQF